MFSFLWVWISYWTTSQVASDLKHHGAHVTSLSVLNDLSCHLLANKHFTGNAQNINYQMEMSLKNTHLKLLLHLFGGNELIPLLKLLFFWSADTQITRFTWPTWGPPGSCRPQVGPKLAPWTLLSGYRWLVWSHSLWLYSSNLYLHIACTWFVNIIINSYGLINSHVQICYALWS